MLSGGVGESAPRLRSGIPNSPHQKVGVPHERHCRLTACVRQSAVAPFPSCVPLVSGVHPRGVSGADALRYRGWRRHVFGFAAADDCSWSGSTVATS